MQSRTSTLACALVSLQLLALSSCRTAKYEVVGIDETKPPEPPCADCNINFQPSADIESYVDGKAANSAVVETPVVFRPSADTLDPDDFLKDGTCATHPGIVQAIYRIQAEAFEKVMERKDCSDFDLPYRFKTAGAYLVALEVKSNEAESARASLTFMVSDASNPGQGGGSKPAKKGFKITAYPLIVVHGEKTVLTSNCEADHQADTDWDLGDGRKTKGARVQYTFEEPGSYEVQATCKDMKASLTIVVLPKGSGVDTSKPPIKKPVPAEPTPPPTTPGQNNPGQNNPGQNNPGQSNPNQNATTQSDTK